MTTSTSNPYTFSNVTGNHTIQAVFTNMVSVQISWTSAEFSSVQYKFGTSGSYTNATNGASINATIGTTIYIKGTPATGKNFSSVTVRNLEESETVDTITPSSNVATWEIDPFDTEFELNTTIKSYTITASAGTGGTISPSGNISVNHGGSQSFTATPSSGYKFVRFDIDT